MCAFPTCMCVHHMHVWCRFSGTGVMDCEPPYECWASERVSGALNL